MRLSALDVQRVYHRCAGVGCRMLLHRSLDQTSGTNKLCDQCQLNCLPADPSVCPGPPANFPPQAGRATHRTGRQWSWAAECPGTTDTSNQLLCRQIHRPVGCQHSQTGRWQTAAGCGLLGVWAGCGRGERAAHSRQIARDARVAGGQHVLTHELYECLQLLPRQQLRETIIVLMAVEMMVVSSATPSAGAFPLRAAHLCDAACGQLFL